MRIAQVAPLFERVPPRYYGGTERVVSHLTEELCRQGHDVTLFASGDSITAARLVPGVSRSLRLDPDTVDQLAHHVVMMEQVCQQADQFDLIHWHIDYLHYPLSRRLGLPNITTLHGRLDIPDLRPVYREFADMPVVSISDSQRIPLPGINWQATVHHGLPADLLQLQERPQGYFAFLGRISPEKRVDRAIEIARRTGVKLRIAAKVDRVDQEYFAREIEPLLDDPLIEYIGEIADGDKQAFLGNARALLFPIDWAEPFGLVMIEAMACGTPVIAWSNGSVPEVMLDGVSGRIVDSMDAAVAAAERIGEMSRVACRAYFESRFTARQMASDYVAVYQRLLERRSATHTRVMSHAG